MAALLFRLKKRIQERFELVKDGLPVIVLSVYSFGGAAILWAVDGALPVELISDLGLSRENCLGSQTYWGAIYYVNTVYTTIGWGNIYPCTWAAKLLTVIYALLGIPLVFMVLTFVGRICTLLLDKAWTMLYLSFKRHRRRNNLDPEKSLLNTQTQDEVSETPISFALVLTAVWVLISSAYFASTEGWTFVDSLYFSMIAFTTCGFGDFAPRHKDYGFTLVVFFFLFVGLALVSMAIQLVQEHIQHMCQRVRNKILAEYRRRLVEGEEGNARTMLDVQKLISESWWVSKFMSKKQFEELVQQGDKLASMQVKAVQATPDTLDAGVDNSIKTTDTSTDSTVIACHQEVDATARISEQATQHSPTLNRRDNHEAADKAIQAKSLSWFKPTSLPRSSERQPSETKDASVSPSNEPRRKIGAVIHESPTSVSPHRSFSIQTEEDPPCQQANEPDSIYGMVPQAEETSPDLTSIASDSVLSLVSGWGDSDNYEPSTSVVSAAEDHYQCTDVVEGVAGPRKMSLRKDSFGDIKPPTKLYRKPSRLTQVWPPPQRQ